MDNRTVWLQIRLSEAENIRLNQLIADIILYTGEHISKSDAVRIAIDEALLKYEGMIK